MCLCEEHVMLGRFEDQSVLITGAAGAIGWATAQRLALEGASVTIWDVDDKLIAEAQTEIQRTNYQIRLEQVELLDAHAIEQGSTEMIEKAGHINVLGNKTGKERGT